MKAFIVKSGELGKSWSVKAVLEDKTIKKYCPTCGHEMLYFTLYENGKESDVLRCPVCKEAQE